MAGPLDDYTHLAHLVERGRVRVVGEGRSRRVVLQAGDLSVPLVSAADFVRADFWADLISNYGYEPARIASEVTLQGGTADLVVYQDDERRRPFAVIECRADGISDSAFDQAVETAVQNLARLSPMAKYAMVVAGSTRSVLDFSAGLRSISDRDENVLADLPKHYGSAALFKFSRKGERDIVPVTKQALISAIRKCHQTLWGGGRMSPPMAFGELCKVIFVKISDERMPRREGEPYDFQILSHESSHHLARRIDALYAKQRRRDPEIFADDIRIDPATLRTLVSHLEWISLHNTDLDTKGLAFEQFMDGFFKGDFGQYFTPREIIHFAIGMVQPQSTERVLDPSCGSGGFLLASLDAIRREADDLFDPDSDEHGRHWHAFANENLFGIEINEEIARVAKMNMILHDDGHTNVIAGDSLDSIDRLFEVNDGFERESFDVILTNPPFGAQILAAERSYLADYELGTLSSTSGPARPRRSQKSEVLFIERIAGFLKAGTGRAAVVLPDGILTNPSQQFVRDFLIKTFQIWAVISLPDTAFSHFGTAVKASILVLRKRAPDEIVSDDERIFMAAPAGIGYDAQGRETALTELPSVLAAYHQFRAEA